MNRQIRQLAGALIVLYIVLFAALNYWQVGRTEELASIWRRACASDQGLGAAMAGRL